MLRGGWRYIVPIGLSALAAFSFAVLIYQDAQQAEASYVDQAYQAAKAARDSGPIHAKRACAIVPASERAECQANEYNAARERERNEYDLQAQLVTSAWTRAMGLAALVAMVVGIVGVGLVYTTFYETRRGAEYARQTLRTYIAKERALLIPSRARTASDKELDRSGFVLELNNAGLAPGTIERTRWSYLTERKWPKKFTRCDHSKRTLAPEGEGRTPLLEWEHEQETGGPLFLVGQIEYESLTERFVSPFSYRIDFIPDDGYVSAYWVANETNVEGRPEHT